MATPRQANFNGGEIAPELSGRTDHPRYASSLRKLLNFIPKAGGGAKNRPGTKFIASSKDPTQKAILVPFVFSSTQTYVLEFGNLYVRFFQNGGQILNPTTGLPYEVVTPFTTLMLPYLRCAQSGDILTICYGGQDGGAAAIAPQELRRLGHTNWTIGATSFAAPTPVWSTSAPALLGSVQNTSYPVADASHPAKDWTIKATILYADTMGRVFETAPTTMAPPSWSSLTTYSAGDVISSAGVTYTSLQNANLNKDPATQPTWWAKGMVIYPDKAPIQVLWNWGPTYAAGKVIGVNLYQGRNNIFGFIGSMDGSTASQVFFTDGATPDYSLQPPKSTDPFALFNPDGSSAGFDYPACVAYFEQRRLFGRQGLRPHRINGSKTGRLSNFDTTFFTQNDDAISFDLASLTLDEIRALVPLSTLFMPTQSGVWTMRGYQGALSPTSVNARKQEHGAGASWVNPARVGDAILYEQDGGGAIFDFVYDPIYDVGRGSDVSLWASHFFEGHTVVQMAYAARPFKTVWVVRDDGLLLGITYVRSTDPSVPSIFAWHQHQLGGSGIVESVCVVPEGTEDAVYLLVKRTVNGATRRDVERMQTRLVSDVRLGIFLDAALTFDGRNTGAVTMKFTSDTTYAGGEEGTILASAGTFVPDDVGSAIDLDPNGIAGGPFRITIIGYTDATHVRAQLDHPLAAAFQAVASTSWGFARKRFSGLTHLEGMTVVALADGGVATAGRAGSSLVVTAGQITLDEPGVIVHAGLPYVSDLELLDLPAGKLNAKSISRVALEVVSSRGFYVGQDFDHLKEWRQREVKDAWGNPPLATKLADVTVSGKWDLACRVAVRQVDPLPLTIVAVIREVVGGGT